MGTLLKAIGIVLETYFEFGFPNAYAIGDSLRPWTQRANTSLGFCAPFHPWQEENRQSWSGCGRDGTQSVHFHEKTPMILV